MTSTATRAEAIAAGLAGVRQRMAEAARAAGRAPDAVRLVAVSKKMSVADIEAALAAGQRDFGENYAQELRDKQAAFAAKVTASPSALSPSPSPVWHFIGPLQSNKVKYVAGQVALLHSVDSKALLDEIDRRGRDTAVLIQVNLAGEEQKRGVSAAQLPALLDHVSTLSHARCQGLMLIPPLTATAAANRPQFAALRALRDHHAATVRPRVELAELSMGMSHDFDVAIAEGATIVRVGTAIFGERPQAPPAATVPPVKPAA
ncbi:MAG TPA: YggS family pyridoxal phosphate-dependent enzyme [Polyangia bacterium]|nr:YggS family pyridoxal phosphate-dependent enzyme [Polyangia bacterium]